MSDTNPDKNLGVNSETLEGQVVPVSLVPSITTAVCIIYNQ